MTVGPVVTMALTVVLVALLGAQVAVSAVRLHARRRLGPIVADGRSGRGRSIAWFADWRRRRRAPSAGSTAAELAATLDAIARRCASGDSMSTALVDAATSSALAGVARAVNGGASLRVALDAAAGAGVDTAYALHVLRLCAANGGNVGESLDRAAATLRERHAIAADRVAQGAQARLSAKVLTILPVAFAAWTLTTSADVRAFTTTPAGVAVLGVGLALNVAGGRWMQRTIRGTS